MHICVRSGILLGIVSGALAVGSVEAHDAHEHPSPTGTPVVRPTSEPPDPFSDVQVCEFANFDPSAPQGFAYSVPAGFLATKVFTLSGPMATEFAPDGTMWVAQGGNGEGMHMWIYDEPTDTLTKIHSFEGFPTHTRGLHDFVLDPDFDTNGHVWIYRTVLGDEGKGVLDYNRLSRFTFANGGLEDETIFMEGPGLQGVLHEQGCLAFTSQKTLFLTTGDDGLYGGVAEDPASLLGKVFHMNRDGSPAWDVPDWGAQPHDPRLWAKGLRNPFRCGLQPESDNLFIGDVGSSLFEEINVGAPGTSFGWSATEGPNPPGVTDITYPIYSYPHVLVGDPPSPAGAITGLAIADAGDLVPEYEGNLFFADYVFQTISRMELDDAQNPYSVEIWASDFGPLADLVFGPDGALYATVRGWDPGVMRIDFIGGTNRRPQAIATALPDSGDAPLAVSFDGSGSTDPDDDTLSFAWDLGDGQSAQGPTANNVYPQGVYEAKLTVDDGNGLDDDSPVLRIVSGNHRPTTTITSPTAGAFFNAGDEITYSGAGVDPEEGAIPCSQMTWQIVFHHNIHTHPFIGPAQGDCSGSFVWPTVGEPDPDVWFRIHLQTEDTGVPIGAEGFLADSKWIDVFPNVVTMQLETTPVPDLPLLFDQQPVTAPASIQGVVGVIRYLGAPTSVVHTDGHTYAFDSWSHGGPQDQQISTPAGGATYTASFVCDTAAEVNGLTVDRSASGVKLEWDAVAPGCSAPGTPYRVWVSPTARPVTGAGSFPVDPPFTEVGSPTIPRLMLTWEGDGYFLVTAVDPDLEDGTVGHYPAP